MPWRRAWHSVRHGRHSADKKRSWHRVEQAQRCIIAARVLDDAGTLASLDASPLQGNDFGSDTSIAANLARHWAALVPWPFPGCAASHWV